MGGVGSQLSEVRATGLPSRLASVGPHRMSDGPLGSLWPAIAGVGFGLLAQLSLNGWPAPPPAPASGHEPWCSCEGEVRRILELTHDVAWWRALVLLLVACAILGLATALFVCSACRGLCCEWCAARRGRDGSPRAARAPAALRAPPAVSPVAAARADSSLLAALAAAEVRRG